MKQIHNKTPWLAAAAVVLLLTTGCSKEAETPAGAVYSDVPILAASELAQDNVVVMPQSGTRAGVDPTQTMTFYLVRADETDKGTGAYGAYTTTPLTATRAAGTGAQALTFATPQYYLTSNAKTRLTGWWPAATSLTGSVVSWTLDGTKDILTAAEQAGNASTPMPNLVFNHSLAQVQIHAYALDANAQNTWGTISKIELVEQSNTCTYDFSADAATGAVRPKSGTTTAFTVGNISDATIPIATAAPVGDPVMIAPQTASTVLKLEVTTSKRSKISVSMPAGVYEASKAYVLKLKFNAFAITATASIGTWQTVDRPEQEVVPSVPLKIGDMKDGGVVYWVDDTDVTNCRVFSLDQGSSLAWSAQNTYVLGAAGQNETDGKANVAAMKAYSANSATNVFATDFPAAAFCEAKNVGGVPGWYLPSRDELEELRGAYLANKTLLDNAITANSGTAMASGFFWSTTEYSSNTSYAWSVNFSGGYTSGDSKGDYGSVRCVKTPDPVLNVKVGNVVNGGIVFWVNPQKTHYKIVYADPLNKNGTWSAKPTYSVGCIDQNDGQINVAMMEAYSRDHVSDADEKTRTSGVFATDFPMASWCKALSTPETPAGKWYMPARNEMLAIVHQMSALISNGYQVGIGWTMTSSEQEGRLTHVYIYEGGNPVVEVSYNPGKGLLDNTRCIAYY